MPRSPSMNLTRRTFCLATVSTLLLLQPGCGFMSHVMYWANGNQMEEKFPGLRNKTVAVVCFDANVAGQAGEADALAKSVGNKLAMNVEKIKLVKHQQVLDWIDGQAGNVSDFKDVGRGVKADMVVGIELDQFSTHDGKTVLRGRARVGVKVFDLTKGGEIVYQTPIQPIAYPENGPRPISDNEGAFRSIFIEILSMRIAKDFYPYDKMLDFGQDSLYTGD